MEFPIHTAAAATSTVSLETRPGALARVLQAGSYVTGEVVETLDGGSIVLGLGGHRVRAQTQVHLEPGQQFLARVETDAEHVVLRLLPEGGAIDTSLLNALRAVIGANRSAGELLGSLSNELLRVAEQTSAEGDALQQLVRDLSRHSFQPGMEGADLRDLVETAGLGYEADIWKASRGLLARSNRLDSTARQLASELVDAWSHRSGVELTYLERTDLERALALVLLEVGPASPATGTAVPADGRLAAWIDSLRRLLVRKLGAPTRDPTSEALHEAIASIDAAALEERWLSHWLERLANPSSSPRTGAPMSSEARTCFERDLKGRLLSSLDTVEDATARAAVARALDGLEARQLTNLAQRHSGEPWTFSIPVPDQGRLTSAYFVHRPDDDGGQRARDAEHDEHARRLSIVVDFTCLGAIQIDLVLRPATLSLRFVAARGDTADRLRRDLALLCETLSIDGRTVELQVLDGPVDARTFDAVSPDIRFLREHPLVDVSA